MLQCVVVCCSVKCMHYLAKHVLLSLLKVDHYCVAVCCSVLQCVAVCCSVLQYAAVCCSVLQCVTLCGKVCRSVLQCEMYALLGETHSTVTVEGRPLLCCSMLQSVAVCCIVL